MDLSTEQCVSRYVILVSWLAVAWQTTDTKADLHLGMFTAMGI